MQTSPSLIVLVLFAAWTLLLLAAIAALRAWCVFRGQRSAAAFSPWGDDVSPFSGRLCRAHANCVENLPIFAAVLAAAALSGHGTSTDALAPWFFAARVAQGLVHLWSIRPRAVALRFGLMATQMLILAWWMVVLLKEMAQ